MAEIELRVLNGQCLDRRLGSVRRVKQETFAWETERNADQATVHWRFTTADARIKLKRLYPMTQPGTSTLGALPKRPAAKLAATEAASRARRRAHKKDRAKHALHSLGT